MSMRLSGRFAPNTRWPLTVLPRASHKNCQAGLLLAWVTQALPFHTGTRALAMALSACTEPLSWPLARILSAMRNWPL